MGFLLSTLVQLSLLWFGYASAQHPQCEEITVSACKNMPWNLTKMPNIVGHSSQDDANWKFAEYLPLIEDSCSDQMLFFLCALFVPICTSNHAAPIPPCRDVCFGAKAGCESVVERKYNQSWPVDCNIFPVYDNDVCVSQQAFVPVTNHKLPTDRDNQALSRAPVQDKSRECNCKRKTKMRLRKYVKANFDYVIQARVEGTRRLGTNANSLIMSLTILNIIKNKSDLRLRVNSTLMMFSEHDGCNSVCPVAKTNRQYVIACHEIIKQGRVVFDTSRCMISRWKSTWQGVLQDWERIIGLPDNIRRGELRSIRTNERQRQLRRSAPAAESESAPE